MMAEIYENARSVAACIGTGTTLASLRTAIIARDEQLAKDVLEELEHLNYFTRLWIRQEVILAEEVSIFCGLDRVLWSDLEELMAIVLSATTSSSAQEKFQHGNVLALYNERKSREQPEANSRFHLLSLLRAHGQGKCQDPRDKIYALLSLLPEDDLGRKITPDYSRSTFDIFQQVVVLSSEQSENFYRGGALLVLSDLANWLQLGLHDSDMLEFF
jgi:hypothetical protein